MYKIGIREIFLSSGTIKLKTIKLFDYILGSLVARLLPAKEGIPDDKITKFPIKELGNGTRLLVIRPGGIGDAIFLLPVLKAIKLKYPQLSIDVLCQKRNAAVFSSQAHLVDHVYDSLTGAGSIYKANYDIIVDTEQWHYLTALITLTGKARVKIGFATRPLRSRFFDLAVNYDSNAYELDNFYSLFECLGLQDKIRNIDDSFYLPEDIKAWAGLQIPPKSVTLSIGATVPERRLSVEQGIILAKGILRRGFHPIFLGGEDCLQQSRLIMDQLDHSQVYNFVGKTSLQESAALIKKSCIFIGTDSGLMHLACAMDHPMIAFFGAGNMKKWMIPKPGRISINQNVPCSPCTAFSYGLPVCGGSFYCLREIDLEAVLEQYLKRENG